MGKDQETNGQGGQRRRRGRPGGESWITPQIEEQTAGLLRRNLTYGQIAAELGRPVEGLPYLVSKVKKRWAKEFGERLPGPARSTSTGSNLSRAMRDAWSDVPGEERSRRTAAARRALERRRQGSCRPR